jgi:squalene-hopene/tetraprenyl-beta-curcumene cyclase
MKIIKRILVAVLCLLLAVAAFGAYLWFFEQPNHSEPYERPKAIMSTGNKVLDAIRMGEEYLRVHQEADGNFSKGLLDPKPAFTAMVVHALAHCPDKAYVKYQPFVTRAAEAILARQQPDGAIYTPAIGMPTYVTSVSIMALASLENPAYKGAIERAKKYLLSVQNSDPESLTEGGAGYSANGRVSGDVTGMWIEALKDAGVTPGDPAFKNAEKFLQRLQNNPETNTQPAAGTEVGDDGGFFYRPGESPANYDQAKSGKKIPRSYGLMTYAALKSFLYMDVGKNDPRVQSAIHWAKNHYTLEENCGLEKGQDGLFYYYLTMAKALAAYGEPVLQTSKETVNWAQDMSAKILGLQASDGSWRNDQSSKFMENDSILVTTYAIQVLTICHEELEKQKRK